MAWRTWGLSAVLAVTGCNWVFGVESTRLDMPPDAVGCSGARFGAGSVEYAALPNTPLAAALRGDELEVVYLEFPTGKLVAATRATASAAFDAPADLAVAVMGDDDPSFTLGGERLVFVSTRLGFDWVAFEAVRTADGFAAPTPITLAFGARSVAMSFDGLALYAIKELADEATELWLATRARVEDPFGSPSLLNAGFIHAPSLSPDQLELYFHDSRFALQNQILHMTRASTNDAFDAATTRVVAPGVHPYLTASGELLIYSQSNRLNALRRTCL